MPGFDGFYFSFLDPSEEGGAIDTQSFGGFWDGDVLCFHILFLRPFFCFKINDKLAYVINAGA